MRIKLNAAMLVAVVALLLLAPSCKRQSAGGKRVIAVIPKGVSHFFWQTVHAGADAAAKESNVEIVWKGPAQDTDYAGQINIVEDAINRRVDGICIAPSHKEALVPMVERAQREGIPVTIFDSGIGTENYTSYVATDNRRGGRIAAERLAERLGGKGRIGILGVKVGSVSTDEREEGFQEVIKQKYPGIEIVAFQYGEGDRARSLDRAADILTAHSDLNGFFASNESSTVGVVQAIKQKGMSGKILLVGFDSSPNLIDDLKSGAIDSLVLQNPFKIGYEAVKSMVAKLDGHTPPRLVDTGVKLLTRDNLDTPEMQQLLKQP
jgi:ribose transport system substrate-binding protein